MKRGQFFKSLITIIVAPSVISKIDFESESDKAMKLAKLKIDMLIKGNPPQGHYISPSEMERIYGEKAYSAALEKFPPPEWAKYHYYVDHSKGVVKTWTWENGKLISETPFFEFGNFYKI